MERIIIDGFESLTPQQVFDMAAKHVLGTRQKSLTGDTCSYGGVGCAASVFIKPEWRDKVYGAWSYLYQYGTLYEQGVSVPSENKELIRSLQKCHDNSRVGEHFVESYKRFMRGTAKVHNLNTDIIDQDDKAHGHDTKY